MLMKLLTVFSFLVFFYTTVEGRYRIALLTDSEENSSTKHWVGVKAYGSKGEKTSWMYPRFQTRRAGYDYNDINDVSVGDMTKLEFQLNKAGILFHPDAWKGAKVVINDFVTGKVFEATPGWVENGEVKKVDVKLVANECKDNHPGVCVCAKESSVATPFKLKQYTFDHCLKTCDICYTPNRRDEEASGDVKAAKVNDGGDEVDREGEPEDEDEGPDKHEQEHEDDKE